MTGHRPNLLGCSLPTRFLAGRTDAHGQAVDWFAMYGTADACLASLAGLGVGSIELRDIRAGTDLEDIERAIGEVQVHGLAVTLHLWLPHDVAALSDTIRIVERALSASDTQVPCTLHAHYLTGGVTRGDAIATTVRALAGLCDALARGGSPLLPALELCRLRSGGPVGTTFEELVAIRDAVEAPNLGLCWDVGHGLANHRTGAASLQPDHDFLASVIHTHLHDLDARGSTHWPLVGTDGTAADLIRLLPGVGYRGVYDLELEPGRWPWSDAARRDAVERSVEVLARVVGAARP
jgi:sugar phosphate isomerase/epimerase